MSINGHKTGIQEANVDKEEKKIHKVPTTPLNTIYTLSIKNVLY